MLAYLPLLILSVPIQLIVALQYHEHAAFTPQHLRELKNHTKELFHHAWNSYMKHGFPADEVRPITCEPYGPDYDDPTNMRNDAMANVSLTMLDNLDMLFIMEEWGELENALNYLQENHATLFEQDTVVQVFEALIRWLGGLLSTHLLLTDVQWPDEPRYAEIRRICKNYDGFLLILAYDLGLRLIPAYQTDTNLPFPRVNLAKGVDAVPEHMNELTCTSGATTPYVEFALLSKLTGDMHFERLTGLSYWKIWHSRSRLGLLSMTMNPLKSEWVDSIGGVGALVDSFYEYAVKGAIIFNSDSLWLIFTKAYLALLTHLAQSIGIHDSTLFANVNTGSGEVVSTWIDSLGAFWSGVQVLAGRLTDAILSHLIYLKMWDYFDSVPERWCFVSPSMHLDPLEEKIANAINLEWYPLRPEFIESTYYLFRATKDPMYLQIGLRILSVFETRFKTACGLAGYQDIRTGQLQNRMESFVMGELLKYLYLLFDEANEIFLHQPFMSKKNWVFSTEAHPLWYTPEFGRQSAQEFKENLRVLRQKSTSSRTPSYKRSFIRTLWLKFVISDRKMIDTLAEPPIDRNNSLIDWQRLGITQVRPVLDSFDTCEVKPRQLKTNRNSFLQSGYYTWKNLFLPDAKYPTTLIRPKHLQKHSKILPNHYVELTPAFYHTFTAFAPEDKLRLHLQCAREATTTESDCVFSEVQKPEQHEMYIVTQAEQNSRFAVNDVVIPTLTGRFKLEVLKIGDIDSTNTLITKDYIRKARPNTWVSRTSEVLRVTRANGVKVGRYRTVWTTKESVQDKTMFKVSKDGRIFVQGRYVENFRVI